MSYSPQKGGGLGLPFLTAPATPRAVAGPPVSIPDVMWPSLPPAPTHLHDAVALGDVLGDTGLVAALQEDGPVVIHVQDSDEHGGSAGAPLAYGAIVCGVEGGRAVSSCPRGTVPGKCPVTPATGPCRWLFSF